MIIETSRDISGFQFELWLETPSDFLQCFGFTQIVQTLCDSRARFYKNYILPPLGFPAKFLFVSAVAFSAQQTRGAA